MPGVKQNLVSFPIRLAPSHIDGLSRLREADGIAIQEHVRRALSQYLEREDRKREKKAEPVAQVLEYGLQQTPPATRISYR